MSLKHVLTQAAVLAAALAAVGALGSGTAHAAASTLRYGPDPVADPVADADAMNADARYLGVASVTLAPGTYYVGAAAFSGADLDGHPGQAGAGYIQTDFNGLGAGAQNEPSKGFSLRPDHFRPGPFFVAVPEPATWAMLILGLGMAGVAVRRRRAPRAAEA